MCKAVSCRQFALCAIAEAVRGLGCVKLFRVDSLPSARQLALCSLAEAVRGAGVCKAVSCRQLALCSLH